MGTLRLPREQDCPPRPANGNCQYCDRHVGVKRLHLDHSHVTGRFRAWICNTCNLGIGLFGDSWGKMQLVAVRLRAAERD